MFELRRYWEFKTKRWFEPNLTFNYDKLIIHDYFRLHYYYIYEPRVSTKKRVFTYYKPYRLHAIDLVAELKPTPRSEMKTFTSGWDSETTCVKEYSVQMYTHGSESVRELCTLSYPTSMFLDGLRRHLVVGSYGEHLIVATDSCDVMNDVVIENADIIIPAVYDDRTIYLVVSYPKRTEIWRFRSDDFESFYYARKQLKDYAEKVHELSEISPLEVMTTLWNKGKLVLYNGKHHVLFDVRTGETVELNKVLINYVYSDYILASTDEILDSNLRTVAKLKLEENERSHESSTFSTRVELPFFATFTGKEDRYNLIAFKGFVPVLEISPEPPYSLRVRIIDFVTRSTLRGELHVIRSRYCYDRTALPLSIPSETIAVSDWVRIRPDIGGCVTVMIKDVHGVYEEKPADRGQGITPMVSAYLS